MKQPRQHNDHLPNLAAEYHRLGLQALARYGLEDYQLTFLRHNENLTYKAEDPVEGKAYALRLHEPRHAGFGRHGRDWKMVRSELRWMEAVQRDTGLTIPRPLRNLDGQLVTRLELGEDKPAVNCSMLTWLAGEPPGEEGLSAGQAEQLGSILARLHNHTRHWQPPADFLRPKRDSAYFQGMYQRLWRGVDEGLVAREDYRILGEVIERVITMVEAAPEDGNAHGLIHADVINGNLLLHKGELRLLDFSFSCFAPYTFDLAVCLGDQKREVHQSILKGYTQHSPLPEKYQEEIEGFMLGSLVGSLVFMLPRKQTHGWIRTRLPEIVQERARKYIQGKAYWFPVD